MATLEGQPCQVLLGRVYRRPYVSPYSVSPLCISLVSVSLVYLPLCIPVYRPLTWHPSSVSLSMYTLSLCVPVYWLIMYLSPCSAPCMSLCNLYVAPMYKSSPICISITPSMSVFLPFCTTPYVPSPFIYSAPWRPSHVPCSCLFQPPRPAPLHTLRNTPPELPRAVGQPCDAHLFPNLPFLIIFSPCVPTPPSGTDFPLLVPSERQRKQGERKPGTLK